MAGSDITMSAEALDRLSKMTRLRERMRIAAKIEELAASARGNSVSDGVLYAFAEELRMEGMTTKVMTHAQETAEIDAQVAAEEEDDGLPAVHHLDDVEEGETMIRQMRGRNPGMGLID